METRQGMQEAGPAGGPRHRFQAPGGWLTGALAVAALVAVVAAAIWVVGPGDGSSGRTADIARPTAASSSPTATSTPPAIAQPATGTINLLDPATGELRLVLSTGAKVGNAELSPDGDRLVYERKDSDGRWQVYLLKPDGTERRLTDFPLGAYDPTWSPDGDAIAFAGQQDRAAATDIFVMNADGSRIRRLVGTGLPDGNPDWSPDGSRIAFHARPDHVENVWGRKLGVIWIVSVRTGGLSRLDHHHYSYGEMDPAWSPDGRRLAYSSVDCLVNGRVCRTRLWVMRPDGTHARWVVADNQLENPTWSPDGQSIALEANSPALVGVGWDRAGRDVVIVDLRTGRYRSIVTVVGADQLSWGADGILIS